MHRRSVRADVVAALRKVVGHGIDHLVEVKGTICHFDMAPQALQDEDFELLRLAARAFPIYLPPSSSAS